MRTSSTAARLVSTVAMESKPLSLPPPTEPLTYTKTLLSFSSDTVVESPAFPFNTYRNTINCLFSGLMQSLPEPALLKFALIFHQFGEAIERRSTLLLQYQNQPTPLLIVLKLRPCCHTVAKSWSSVDATDDACDAKSRKVLTATLNDDLCKCMGVGPMLYRRLVPSF